MMMNKKYIASLIGGLLISMALGSHAETPEKKIIGKWYNPHTYRMSGELKGFQFKKGGKCKALGIKILDLKTWKIKDGNLIIEGDRLPQEPGEERSEYRTVEKIEILRNDSLRAFTNDPDLLDVTANGLRISLLVFVVVGSQISISQFFQSIGIAWKAMFLSLSRQVLFLIPAMLLFSRFWGLDGVWYAAPFSDFVAAVTAWLFLWYHVKNMKSKNSD